MWVDVDDGREKNVDSECNSLKRDSSGETERGRHVASKW